MPSVEKVLTDIERVERNESALYERIVENFAISVGEEEIPEEGFESYTDNTPQLQAEKAIALISDARRRVYIPVDIDKEKRRRSTSNTERFFDGWLDAVEAARVLQGLPLLQSEMAWHAYNTGFIISVPLIYKGKSEETEVQCSLWHRLWTRYEMGSKGVKWAAYVQTLKAVEIEGIFGITLSGHEPNANIKVVDYWDDKGNGLIIDQDWHKPLTDHDIGFNPVIIIPVGAMPRVPYQSDKVPDAYKYHGQTGYDSIRHMIKPHNRMMSAYLTAAMRYRKPPLTVSSVDGQSPLSDDPFKEGSAIQLNKARQEELGQVPIPELPRDAGLVTQQMKAQIDVAGISFPFSGLTGERSHSGLSLNVAEHATLVTIKHYIHTIERMHEAMGWSVVRQFSASAQESNLDLKPIELMYPVEKGMRLQTFKPQDVKPFRFRCELEVDMPRDEQQKWIIARMAHEGPNPMLSMQTIMEEILKIPDIDAERAKKMEEMTLNIPTIMMREVFLGLKERLDPDDEEGWRVLLSVWHELEMLERQQANEMKKALFQGMQVEQAMAGAMAPQPLQAPMQGTNPGSMMPMQGLQPGFAPPEATSPGLINPQILQMMRNKQGFRPPGG